MRLSEMVRVNFRERKSVQDRFEMSLKERKKSNSIKCEFKNWTTVFFQLKISETKASNITHFEKFNERKENVMR